MNIRKIIRKILSESERSGDSAWGESHQERFDRAIYLTYVQLHKDRDFKHVSAQDFSAFMLSKIEGDGENLESKIVNYDRNNLFNRHRVADSKETWTNKKDRKVVAEVFEETDEWGNSVVSYWINSGNGYHY